MENLTYLKERVEAAHDIEKIMHQVFLKFKHFCENIENKNKILHIYTYADVCVNLDQHMYTYEQMKEVLGEYYQDRFYKSMSGRYKDRCKYDSNMIREVQKCVARVSKENMDDLVLEFEKMGFTKETTIYSEFCKSHQEFMDNLKED